MRKIFGKLEDSVDNSIKTKIIALALTAALGAGLFASCQSEDGGGKKTS